MSLADKIVETASGFYDVEFGPNRNRKRSELRAKYAAAILLRQNTALHLMDIGKMIGLQSSGAVTNLLAMAHRHLDTKPGFSKQFDMLEQLLEISKHRCA